MRTMDDIATDNEQEEQLDPRIVAGWRALESGEFAEARAAAEAVLAESPAAKPAGIATNKGGSGKSVGQSATAGRGGAGQPTVIDATRLDALLLRAACAREEGEPEVAMLSLEQAAKEDPEWCTPELWMAELLSEDPERLDEALRHARRALDHADEEDEYLAALATKAAIELELGRPTEARKTLSGLPPGDAPLDDVGTALDFAQLLMDAGDPAEARVRLKALTEQAPAMADAWYLLGVAAELLEDEDEKRAAWVKTRALDLAASDSAAGAGDHHHHDHDHDHDHGDHHHHDHEHHGAVLTEEVLVAVAEEALAEMPDELRAHMRNVPVVVAELPAAEDVAAGMDPRLLGLFSGTPQSESGGVLAPPSLSQILLFRRNIERMADDEDTLRDEVRTTLLHEAGHFFGLDEASLPQGA